MGLRTSTTDENIEAMKKMIFDIWEVADDVAISVGLCQAIFENILGMKCEVCSKIAKFWTKTKSHGHRSGDANDDPDLLKKVTGDGSWVYGGYDIETKG